MGAEYEEFAEAVLGRVEGGALAELADLLERGGCDGEVPRG